MKLREVTIKNFRCLSNVTVPVADTTILVGENNSGKTAFLDALKLILSRAQPRSLAFDEYDYHMAKSGDSPQSGDGILIELLFQEGAPDEWPAPLAQALDPIIQTDPVKDIDSIKLRVTSAFDQTAKEMVVKWEFLDLSGRPIGGKGAAAGNVLSLLSYVRLFYMAALRDCADEFSPRSQFWGKILKDLKFGPEQRKALQEELGKLNTSLLKADPRLEQVRAAIENIHDILSVAVGQSVSIQALPLQPWDLMSKAQLVVKPRGGQVDFPLGRHGQGMQSLAVMFLFQAYIDILLKPSFEPETEALLALEEPEAHLHPHAARAFARSLGQLKSQKIISSHSPYFIQEIPFKAIRMFRRNGATTKVLYIRDTFSAQIPHVTGLEDFCNRSGGKFEYHTGKQELTVRGKVEQNEFRALLTLYANSRETHATLKKLSEEAQLFLTDSELADLETYAKRIRGEVLFARGWLLCEGQSEYLLVRYFAELLGKPLDQYGISVIDFQNNGSPGTFVGLAKAFEIPWVMFCDNDPEGVKFSNQVQARGVTGTELATRVRPLPGAGIDLETFLARNGFLQEYEEIATARGGNVSTKRGDAGHEEEVAKTVKSDKTGTMLQLLEKLRAKGMTAAGIPAFFSKLLEDLHKEVA